MYFNVGLPGTSWIGLKCWEIEGCMLDWNDAGLEQRKSPGESPPTKGKSARLGFSSYRRWFVSVECATTVLETGNVGEVAGWRRKRCNGAVTGTCWLGVVQPKCPYWLAWASSIIGSPGLLIYKLYIYIYHFSLTTSSISYSLYDKDLY